MSVKTQRYSVKKVEKLFAYAIDKVKADAEGKLAKQKATAKVEATKALARQEELAKQKATAKAETAKTIAKVKAEAEKKAKTYTNTITKVKAEAARTIVKVKTEAEKKAKVYTGAIATIKAETEEKAKKYNDKMAGVKVSSRIGALFLEAVAKQKAKSEAEAAEEITRLKAEAEEKARDYTDTIAKVKAEAEEAIAEQKTKSEAEAAEAIARIKAEAEQEIAAQKIKSDTEAEAIAKVRVEAEEKTRAYTETTNAVKTEAAEAIAMLKTEAADTITTLKTEAAEAIATLKTEAAEAIAKVRDEVEQKARIYPDAKEKVAAKDDIKERPVSETIKKMTQSSEVLPEEQSATILTLCAKDIMQKEPVWASPDNSVQQTIAKMKQHHTGYIIVGNNGVLEGIVSKSNLSGAVSPYLRPVFAKWRRPLDDATLKIKIKWIMSRPVYTITPQTALPAIVKNMCQFRVRCLPVVGQQNKVLGLVTEANIFKSLLKLKARPNTSASGKAPQAHPSTHHSDHTGPQLTQTQTMQTSPLHSQ